MDELEILKCKYALASWQNKGLLQYSLLTT